MGLQCPVWPEEGNGFPGTGVKDGYELLCGSWEAKPGPLEEQSMFSAAKPSLHPNPLSFLLEALKVLKTAQ